MIKHNLKFEVLIFSTKQNIFICVCKLLYFKLFRMENQFQFIQNHCLINHGLSRLIFAFPPNHGNTVLGLTVLCMFVQTILDKIILAGSL